jgi:hypothetical protein
MARLASREARRRAVKTWGWEEGREARRDHSAIQRHFVWEAQAAMMEERMEGDSKYQMQWARTM